MEEQMLRCLIALLALGFTYESYQSARFPTPRPVLRSNAIDNASPAPPGSTLPNLSTAPDGRVFLSWVEPAGTGRHALNFAMLADDSWSPARTVAEGENWFVNWADFPSVVPLADGRLAAHWLAKSGTDTYAYDIQVSMSTDEGTTWSTPITPHRDGIGSYLQEEVTHKTRILTEIPGPRSPLMF
jgi:hypothetical protein